MLEQHRENLQRLILEPDPDALPAQLPGLHVQLERVEADGPRVGTRALHWGLVCPEAVVIAVPSLAPTPSGTNFAVGGSSYRGLALAMVVT